VTARHSGSADVILHSAAEPVGLVQEELPVAERGLGILIDRNNDGLDVRITPTFARS
jgi:hypothetical protein